MRLAAYLSLSRHGIFYFRYPLPNSSAAASRQAYIKMSLGTREPSTARQLSRVLSVAGQTLLSEPSVRAMRYDEMRRHVRDHFIKRLEAFRARSEADGPPDGLNLHALRASDSLSESDADLWVDIGPSRGRSWPPEGLLHCSWAISGTGRSGGGTSDLGTA
ncbi:DUF6538 domain-containing protein [Sulfitobacter sp. 1A15299]|uniref:DUF6538 domain-containing protein n=1 Tax=Sulfitobacter sp. 1A15299 TaxID=3368598 RepID=UPI003746AD79